ncbi:hypothetical protein FBU30_003723 [Linnemannia zychae]|nr:hypothetical protein FBU30_003723 [Linnemannia zychae]
MPASQPSRTGLSVESPLDNPEILSRVLSYVCQRTLSRSCLLVSRQWLTAARRYMVLEYAWSDCLEDGELLSRALTILPWMTRLQWFSGSPRDAAGTTAQERHWAVLLHALERANTSPKLLSPNYFYNQHYKKLRTHLLAHFLRHPPQPFLNILTEGRSKTGLHELELHGDHLHISAGRNETLTGFGLLRSTNDGKLILNKVPTNNTCMRTCTWPLKTVIFEKATVSFIHISHLLEEMTNLKSFKYVGLGTHFIPVEMPRQVLDSLRLYSHRLDPFFISGVDLDKMVPDRPNPSERILSDFTPDLMRTLQNPLSNNITSLEFHDIRFRGRDPGILLHDYLCSAPNLLHLKAAALSFMLEHMDIHGLLTPQGFFTASIHNSLSKKIWKCQKLRTLHINISTPSLITAAKVTGPLPEHSRIFFGYISRVCPELRDIKLFGDTPIKNHPCLDISLLGGLCLLGRLKHLERLTVEKWRNQGNLNARNLDWIIEAGWTPAKKKKRQEYLKKIWIKNGLMDTKGLDLQYKDASTVATQNYASRASLYPQGYVDWTGVNPMLREELQYLGLLAEIKTFFDELDNKGEEGCCCFPVLNYLSLCSPGEIELSPEEEIRRVVVTRSDNPWVQP